MSSNRKATMAKRQREADQRERVKQREARRVERRSRIQQRVEAGVVTTSPAIQAVEAGPVLGVDGPRSISELRAARAASNDEEAILDRIVDPDELERSTDPDDLIG